MTFAWPCGINVYKHGCEVMSLTMNKRANVHVKNKNWYLLDCMCLKLRLHRLLIIVCYAPVHYNDGKTKDTFWDNYTTF